MACNVCFFVSILSLTVNISYAFGDDLYKKFNDTRNKVKDEIDEVIESVSSSKKNVGFKNYTGKGFTEDMLLKLYHFDQTILVGGYKDSELQNCEIFERYEEKDKLDFLEYLRSIGLTHQQESDFENMMHLMKLCQEIDERLINGEVTEKTGLPSKVEVEQSYHDKKSAEQENSEEDDNNSILKKFEDDMKTLLNPLDKIRTVATGTLWCGPGDLAEDYYDLGEDHTLDRCCRTHDLCPTKIYAKTTKYDQKNPHRYTMSQCDCDARLKSCFEKVNTKKSRLLKAIFFDILKVKCLDEVPSKQTTLLKMIDS